MKTKTLCIALICSIGDKAFDYHLLAIYSEDVDAAFGSGLCHGFLHTTGQLASRTGGEKVGHRKEEWLGNHIGYRARSCTIRRA